MPRVPNDLLKPPYDKDKDKGKGNGEGGKETEIGGSNPEMQSLVITEDPETSPTTKSRFSNLKIAVLALLLLAVLVELISFTVPDENYKEFWYPVMVNFELLALSIIPVLTFWKASCWYTRIATLAFAGVQLINLAAIFITMSFVLYHEIITGILSVGAILLLALKIIKMLIKRCNSPE